MADPGIAHTTEELAERLGARLLGSRDIVIRGIDALHEAGPDQVSFFESDKYRAALATTKAGAVVVPEDMADAIDDRAVLVVPHVGLAVIELLAAFAPPEPRPDPGVHPSAVVDPGATVDPSARIGPLVSIGARAEIGADVTLHPGVRIYADVSIGAGTTVHANAVIRERCRIGRQVLIGPGAVIGFDGFGFVPRPDGQGLLKVPHIGTVEIHDGAEIGAATCIDRGKFGATVVGAGSKIDNLVQIAHNCRIAECVVMAAQVGLSGSVTIEAGAMLGGQSGVADHLRIGRGAALGGGSGVIGDIPPGAHWFGYPAQPSMSALRQLAALRKLPGLIRRLDRGEDS